MKSAASFMSLVYLLVLSWTNAFALSAYVRVPVIACILAILLGSLSILVSNKNINTESLGISDLIVILFLVGFCISSILNPTDSSINYVSAYIYVFLFSYVGFKMVLSNFTHSSLIKKGVVYGVFLTSVTALLEIYLYVVHGVDIGSYMMYFDDSSVLYAGLLPRVIAYSTEPAILAFYLETIGVISLRYVCTEEYTYTFRVFYIISLVLSWAFTFSAASLVSLATGSIFALVIWSIRNISLRSVFVVSIIFGLIGLSLFSMLSFAEGTILEGLVRKITLQGGGSVNVRLKQWSEGFHKIMKYPLFGEGPGTAASQGEGSNLSWYIFLGAESGLLNLCLLFLFLFSKFCFVVRNVGTLGYTSLIALVAALVHLSVISTFFYPFLWASLALFDVMHVKSRY